MPSVLDGSVADDAPRADPPGAKRPWQVRADEFDRAHRRGRRRLWGACVACVAALTLAVPLVIAPMFADEQYPEVCDALFAPVQGLDIELRHANGFTRGGFSTDWAGVFTDVLWVADDQRPAIAAAVTADEAGYQRILAGVSNDLRPAIEHLHATVSNPELASATTSWNEGTQVIESPETLAALQAVNQFGFEGCGRKMI